MQSTRPPILIDCPDGKEQVLVLPNRKKIKTSGYYRQIKKTRCSPHTEKCAFAFAPVGPPPSLFLSPDDQVIDTGSYTYCLLLSKWVSRHISENVISPPYSALTSEAMFIRTPIQS